MCELKEHENRKSLCSGALPRREGVENASYVQRKSWPLNIRFSQSWHFAGYLNNRYCHNWHVILFSLPSKMLWVARQTMIRNDYLHGSQKRACAGCNAHLQQLRTQRSVLLSFSSSSHDNVLIPTHCNTPIQENLFSHFRVGLPHFDGFPGYHNSSSKLSMNCYACIP